MARTITAAERFKKARVLIQRAYDLPVPADGGKFNFSYIAQVKDLLRQARESGATTFDGLGMLIAQGALSFEMWTGIWPPVDVMRAAWRVVLVACSAVLLLGPIGGAFLGKELVTRGVDWIAGVPYAGTMAALAAPRSAAEEEVVDAVGQDLDDVVMAGGDRGDQRGHISAVARVDLGAGRQQAFDYGKVTAGKETVWQFSAGERGFTVRLKRVDHGPSAPQQVHWSWGRAGCEQHVTMRDLGDGRLGIIDGEHGTPSRVISAIQPDLSMLVSAQLAHRARDRVFELALETANSMTSVLL